MRDNAIVKESFHAAMEQAKKLVDGAGIVGFGNILLIDGDGRLKSIEPFANRITTAGDEYYIRRAAAGISPANPAAPTLLSGMKLGTGTTAVTKSGAASALITYIAGSNNPFDAAFPSVAAVGGDAGWNITYKTTWPAGDVTNAAITEVALVNDAATDATTTAANTVARVVFAAKNKTVDDTLAITWVHTFLGA